MKCIHEVDSRNRFARFMALTICCLCPTNAHTLRHKHIHWLTHRHTHTHQIHSRLICKQTQLKFPFCIMHICIAFLFLVEQIFGICSAPIPFCSTEFWIWSCLVRPQEFASRSWCTWPLNLPRTNNESNSFPSAKAKKWRRKSILAIIDKIISKYDTCF